jgi:phage gp45-like
LSNVVRRIVFGTGSSATAGGRWAVLGYETADDTEGQDAPPVEVFAGLSIYARPATTDAAEGILLHVGAQAEHPAIAALRNEDARRRYVEEFGDLQPGEVAIFNSAGATRIHIAADGEILIEAESGQEIKVRSPGGAVDSLVQKSEFQRHTHVTAGTGSPVGPTPLTGGPLTYTTVLKAE